MPVKPTKVDLKAMTMDELRALRININDEIDKREREEYDKAVEDFRKALYKLYSEFPNESCMVDSYITWEDLYDNHEWNF